MNVCFSCIGYGEKDKPNSTNNEDLLNDVRRVNYMTLHLEALAATIRYKCIYRYIYLFHLFLESMFQYISHWVQMFNFFGSLFL